MVKKKVHGVIEEGYDKWYNNCTKISYVGGVLYGQTRKKEGE